MGRIRVEIETIGIETVESIFVKYDNENIPEFLLQKIVRVENDFQRRVYSETGRVLVNEVDSYSFKGEGKVEDHTDVLK